MTRKGTDSEEPITKDRVEEWEVVEDESVARTVVLSVRFNEPEMRLLREEAKRSGGSMSDVVREAVRSRFGATGMAAVLLNATTENVSGLARAVSVTLGSGSDFGSFKQEVGEDSAATG